MITLEGEWYRVSYPDGDFSLHRTYAGAERSLAAWRDNSANSEDDGPLIDLAFLRRFMPRS